MRPRGAAAAAEPEGRRAGQPLPRAPCRCPDLLPQVGVPPPAPAAALSPVSRPSKPQIIFGFFPRSFKVTSSLQYRGSPASSPSSWAACGAPASGRPGPGRRGVRWAGVREREEGPCHLSDLPANASDGASPALFPPDRFSPPSGIGGVFSDPCSPDGAGRKREIGVVRVLWPLIFRAWGGGGWEQSGSVSSLSRRTSSPRFSTRRRLWLPPSLGPARCREDEAAGAAVQAKPVSPGFAPLPLHVQFCSASGLRSLTSILGRGHKGQGIKKKFCYQ